MAQKFLDSEGLSAVLAKVKTAINNAQAAASAPTATATSLGIVMPGTGTKIDTSGKLSVDTATIATVASVNTAAAKAVTDAVAQAKSEIVAGAPEAYDTLKEISDFIADNADVKETLVSIGTNKANAADVYSKTEADATFVNESDLGALTAAEVQTLCDTAFGLA